MTTTSPARPASERLPFRTKLIYGLGDWGNSTTTTIFGFFFAFFLNDVARLSPLYAAPVLLIGGIWDAVNDPMIGVWADRVRTRWGRRRPFFLLGALPFALSFFLLWQVPPWDDQILKAAYYAVVYILFDTSFTLVSVPYTALTPELTEDYDERTRLNGYRMAVSMVGGLISAVAAPIIAGSFEQKHTGYMLMALVFGILAGLPYILLFFNIKERYSSAPRSSLKLRAAFSYTWRNRPFRYAAGIYLTGWVTISLASALFQYYVTYWMKIPGELEIVLGLVQTAALVCVPLIVLLSGRVGKKRAYITGVFWWALVMLALAFLPSESRGLVYVLAALTGPGVAAAHVVPWSIVPDVVEADELETGHRQEATYYGFLVFLQKSGSALALSFMQWVLGATGYVPDAPQNEATLLAIRLLIGLVPAVLLTISMYLAWRFPIDRYHHQEVRAALAEKRARRAETDAG